MKILVTGSEGCIGSRLVTYLELKGHEVLCLDIVSKYRNNYILSNILNLTDVEEKIANFKPQIIYHLAALVSRIICEKYPHTAIETNVVGTNNIIQLCKRLKAKLINFSTSEVYGNQNIEMDETITLNPNNIYGITKLMAEQLVLYESQSNDLKYINVRPFMIYDENEKMGENRSAIIRFAENIIKGIPITIHKKSYRSWLHIQDAIYLFEKLLYIPDNITINLGDCNYVSAEYIVKFMCEYSGSLNTIIKYEGLPDKMTLTKKASFNFQKKLIHYTPQKSIEEGMRLVIDTVKKRLKNNNEY